MHTHPAPPTLSLTRIVLASGRTVDLSDLHLTPTYGDMPETYPCRPVNEERISTLLDAAEHTPPAVPVHLIPPPREYPHQYAGALGPVELLPRVACVARLSSSPLNPAHDPSLYRSGLTVIWFAPAPHIPDPCNTHPALHTVDWPTLARDYALQPPTRPTADGPRPSTPTTLTSRSPDPPDERCFPG